LVRALALILAGGMLPQNAAPPTAGTPLQDAAPRAEKASVCEVARSGAVYTGHTLELTGIVAGLDCMLGVKLVFSDEAQKHEDIRVLFAAVKRNAETGVDAGITGTFEGRYTYSDDGGAQFAVDGIDQLNFPKK
jgi:hypothetical protein